ncbi:glycoside hydrolase family 81 protein [Lepidopterella palustris CBS 459.81]|uniref:Glucan endo-1,3-beta-D-glucosidase 1 n=1 Tax=Lepidopterella palustris CBS 459.81 TaxID=1314670 RepID=A0A8E2E8M6_9PEZI|nr:glycoside hydrolase family 81 protein [Lepidopterella palustris CBS 459.81]
MKAHPAFLEARIVPISTSLAVTTSYSSAVVSSVQSAASTITPSVTGSVNTALPSGHDTESPFNTTSISEPAGSLTAATTTLNPGSTAPTAATSENVFVAIASNSPPAQISSRSDHPVAQLGIVNQTTPAETNKFYANFFLGGQSNSAWTHPYSVSWSKGSGNAKSWGLAISHIERSQLAWAAGTPPEYFINPIGIQSMILSAVELGSSTALTTDSLEAFSANVNLASSSTEAPLISFPLVQGMGFVTGLYNGATPNIGSGIFFRTLTYVGQVNGVTYKYRIVLEDSTNWLLYATPTGSLGAPPFILHNSTMIQGPAAFHGTIQVAKNPANTSGEASYDASAGSYAVNASITGTVDGTSGSYTLAWMKGGIQNQTLLMFGLPHHIASFDKTTSGALTTIQLATTTKGMAQAFACDKFTMVESNLPTEIGFAPWSPSGNGATGSVGKTLSNAAIAAINSAGASELNQNIIAQTSLNSMYYSGKGLAKFAGIVYTLQDLVSNSALAAAGLEKLKDAFNVFVNNTQPLPLVYDTVWKGAVSSGTYLAGDSGLDFGNTYYNDHHFHYGYFVWAAAVIGYLDPTWLTSGTNKAWVDMLVRDYANPSTEDPYFPFSRSFDWYHGHSWAKGLFESGDGKDEESSSEDAFSSYAIKMWGRVTGDPNMEARGNLQLAVQARSLQSYFLLEDGNTVQPAQFIPNKVTGILFENKVDHTTYFGTNPEYIQGIHMIPLNPSSAYTRTATFVKEEWATFFANGKADTVQGGWKGILYANLALIDPVTSYNFFANTSFDSGYLDGGASRTWYLAYAAGLGGAV